MHKLRIILGITTLLTLPVMGSSLMEADAAQRERARERTESAAEREEQLYENGTDALDDHDWRRAAEAFREVARMSRDRADDALYWLAYAQSKMALRGEALGTILELQKAFPKSKWVEDAKQLEVEIRQNTGQNVAPEHAGDDDVKLMALNGLMNSDPERALPLVESLLSSNQSGKIKDRALFVLSQSDSPKAIAVLSRVATDDANTDLQARAIKYLGIMGGEKARSLLHEVYGKTKNVKVKKSVLRSYMISGDRTQLLSLAKGEPSEELRGDAITQLGLVGARNELSDLYATEKSIPLRKKILQAMFLGGNGEKLSELARTEKVPELRKAAIRNLGLLGGKSTGPLLLSIYREDPDKEVRKEVVQALFIQGNTKTLVDLARQEKDPQLKKELVSKISLMGGKDASDYLLELLKE